MDISEDESADVLESVIAHVRAGEGGTLLPSDFDFVAAADPSQPIVNIIRTLWTFGLPLAGYEEYLTDPDAPTLEEEQETTIEDEAVRPISEVGGSCFFRLSCVLMTASDKQTDPCWDVAVSNRNFFLCGTMKRLKKLATACSTACQDSTATLFPRHLCQVR